MPNLCKSFSEVMGRSYRASEEGLKKAKQAFHLTGWTRKDLAVSADCSRPTVYKFLAGRGIEKRIFEALCCELKLRVAEIAYLESEEGQLNPSVSVNRNREQSLANPAQKSTQTDEERIPYAATGTIAKSDIPRVKAILALLQEITGDTFIKIIDIEKGSIRLILEGSQKSLEQIEALFKSGNLTQVKGIIVEDVQFLTPNISEHNEDIQAIDKKQLAFTLAGNLSSEEIQELKAAFTETSDNDKEIEVGNKAHLVQEIITEGAKRLNLIGADLSGANLLDADLSDADLSGANLRCANLRCVNLTGAILRRSNLRGANLSGANLTNVNLSVADLTHATLLHVNLLNSFLIFTKLNHSKLNHSNLNTANLIGANLNNANLIDASLIDADLSDADLSDADLRGAILTRATLTNTNLTSANLSYAILTRANLWNATLLKATLTFARLVRIDLSGANLSGADVSGANLSGANLSGTNLSGTNLSGTNLMDAVVEKAQFGANLGLTEEMKRDLKRRGAMFEDSPGIVANI